MRLARTSVVVFSTLVLVAACSSGTDATPGGTPDGGADSAVGPGTGVDSGAGSGGSDGGSEGGSSITDASTDATSDFDAAATTAALTQLQGWLDVYRNGGTIDYENDGTIDVTVTANADGSRDIKLPGTHGTRTTMHFVSKTNITKSNDDNDDGVMDATWVVSKTGDTVTSVTTADSDFDGTPDHRVTTTTNTGHTATTIEDFLYALDGSGKAWGVTAAYETDSPQAACSLNPKPPPVSDTGKPQVNTPGTCDGYCNYNCTIPNLTTTLDPIPGVTNMFFVTNGPSACVGDHRTTIEKVLGSLPTAIKRLKTINPDKLNDLQTTLAVTKLSYGCGSIPACLSTGVVAATVEDDPGDEGLGAAYKTVFGTGTGNAIDEPTETIRVSAVAELLFHELFHLYKHHDNGDLQGNSARDDIYSCSRYMAQWKSGLNYYLGFKDDASSARDGAVCADAKHKDDFGFGQSYLAYDHLFYETAPGSETSQMLCHVDQGPTAFATCGVEHVWTYCDQTAMEGPTDPRTAGEVNVFECATVCPPGTSPAVPCTLHVADPKWHRVDGCNPIPPSVY